MKLNLQKMKLVGVSFLCGFFFCAVLLGFLARPPGKSPVVASGPLLAATQFQPAPGPVIWRIPNSSSSRGVRIERDSSSDGMELLPGGKPSPRLDLIDTRHQPAIDLKGVQ